MIQMVDLLQEGGTFWSPKGAYYSFPNVEGRANFGFVAKYKKGTQKVDGNTEFQFKNGGINFPQLLLSGYVFGNSWL